MVYQWKVPIYKVSAQSAGEELERIKEQRGSLTPQNIVEESRGSDAVLHDCFEWDDKKAAELHRNTQARQILRMITVSLETSADEKPVQVRAFVPMCDSYEPINEVIAVPDMYSQLLNDAKSELYAFKRKYQTIQELVGVMTEIDNILTA